MFRLIWKLSSRVHALFQYAPTNVLLGWLRTRRGLKWAVPAMLLGVAYLGAAAIVTTILDRGGPGWLNAVALVLIWNGLKFLINGPISLILLARVRLAERRAQASLSASARSQRVRYEAVA